MGKRLFFAYLDLIDGISLQKTVYNNYFSVLVRNFV